MSVIDENGYVLFGNMRGYARALKHKKLTNYANIRNWCTVKAYKDTSAGIPMRVIYLPEEYLGKKVRVKIMLIENEEIVMDKKEEKIEKELPMSDEELHKKIDGLLEFKKKDNVYLCANCHVEKECYECVECEYYYCINCIAEQSEKRTLCYNCSRKLENIPKRIGDMTPEQEIIKALEKMKDD